MNNRFTAFALSITIAAASFSITPGKRTEFAIPLIQISAGEDAGDPDFKRIRLFINGTDEYAVITRYTDTHVKNKGSGTEKIQYQETPDQAFVLSSFEGKQLSRVVRSLISTLEIFERDLSKQKWDRCLYLDSFFPRFLQRFHYLVCAARNSTDAMPPLSSIPDSEFDVSLNSPLSDKRIMTWQKQNDHIVKLRIVSKELCYQLEQWDKKELSLQKRDFGVSYSSKAEEAYGLFVKLYFNLAPQPHVPEEGQHL